MGDPVPERLRLLLAAHGAPWTAPVEHAAVLGSTSDRAKELARAGAPAWSVVLADRQTAGRGRQGRSWTSPAGNLFLSVLLEPPASPAWSALTPLAAGVAVAEALERFGLPARLKWPNDVVVGDRKVAGLLAESLSAAAGVERIVLGVGVNVALDPATLQEDLAGRTTSIRHETGRSPDPLEVAAAVLARLTVWYHALARGGTAAILEEWRRRSVPWWGKAVEVRSGEEVVTGLARGVDERGALVVERADGSLAVLLSGEARELRLS